jgi:protein gp37
MADVFEPRDELDEPRLRLLDLIAETPELDWLLLTKRPELAGSGSTGATTSSTSTSPLPNVWLGTSVENQRFTWRADALRETPAAVRFISAEPLLGSLIEGPDRASASPRSHAALEGQRAPARMPLDLDEIDWLIVGGESGPTRARCRSAVGTRATRRGRRARHRVLLQAVGRPDVEGRREGPRRPRVVRLPRPRTETSSPRELGGTRTITA